MTGSPSLNAVLEGRADQQAREAIRELCSDAQGRRIAAPVSQLLSVGIVNASIPAAFVIAFAAFLISYGFETRAYEKIQAPVTIHFRVQEDGRTLFAKSATTDDLPLEINADERQMLRPFAYGDSSACDANPGRILRSRDRGDLVISTKLFSRTRHVRVTMIDGSRRTTATFDVPCSARTEN